MEVTRTSSELRASLAALHARGRSLGFVPTMGAFHEGHLSLVRAARGSCDAVAVSIFVNPLQFGPREDLSAYPRDEERDLSLAAAEGIDAVFVPSVEEMYPRGHATSVSVGRLGAVLEGASRPGHFTGVCTVVAKLLNLVAPDAAFFGRKDAQQVAVIRRMVTDLSIGVRIEVCDTVRDHDGLALSSRNANLTDAERAQAPVLFRALREAHEVLTTGGSPDAAENRMRETTRGCSEVALDYARAVDADAFDAPQPDRPVLLLIAARVGRTRLIDNLLWTPA